MSNCEFSADDAKSPSISRIDRWILAAIFGASFGFMAWLIYEVAEVLKGLLS